MQIRIEILTANRMENRVRVDGPLNGNVTSQDTSVITRLQLGPVEISITYIANFPVLYNFHLNNLISFQICKPPAAGKFFLLLLCIFSHLGPAASPQARHRPSRAQAEPLPVQHVLGHDRLERRLHLL
jgi:hypothetical protein